MACAIFAHLLVWYAAFPTYGYFAFLKITDFFRTFAWHIRISTIVTLCVLKNACTPNKIAHRITKYRLSSVLVPESCRAAVGLCIQYGDGVAHSLTQSQSQCLRSASVCSGLLGNMLRFFVKNDTFAVAMLLEMTNV